jgi:ArsR family transcriptional regulator, arsenate/arsenite/antimonite-responsive transcriptional repressor
MGAALPVIACCKPLAAPSLTDDEAEATARLFKALADPARVKIVNLLIAGGEGACVCDLTGTLGLSQPTVSHHLKKLTAAGLLRRQQLGTSACFTLDPDAAARLAIVTDLRGGSHEP